MLRRTTFSPRRTLAPALLLLSLLLSLFAFQGIALAAATPTATLNVVPSVQIGADFSFSVTFDNTGTDTGYGPFVDLILPVTGADGAGAALDDGIDFSGATYLGQPVVATQLTFPPGVAPTCVAHPYALDNTGAPIQVCGTPGDKLVVLQLPFGSFTPAQPPAVIVVNAHMSNLADLNVPLTIQARSGFQYGADPLANPTVDPSITGSFAAASVNTTATLFTLTKNYIGPEDETATGPNFPRQYEIIVDVATGQTITNLDLTDLLPNNMQFVSLDVVTGNGTSVITPISTPGVSTPGGTLARRLDTVVGTSGTNDARMLFTFYIPRVDATSAVILNPNSGDDTLSINDARAQGNWQPIDLRDPPTPVVSDVTAQDHILTDKSIAIQKSVANTGDVGMPGYSVGDALEYTLQFQVSDYFAFQNVVISDTISDGQHYDPSFTPQLTIGGNGFTLPAAGMSGANFTVAPNYTPADPAPNDGTTTFTFRVSDELVTRGQNGRLIGGCVPPGGTGGPPPDCSFNDGATTGTLVFRTIIQDRFTDAYPSGDPPIDSGDRLNNAVTITGDVLDNATLAPTGLDEADTSAASLAMVFGELSKTIYARNGVIGAATEYAPGDTITYRISYSLAASDFENLSFTDYLPLPILASSEMTTFDAAYDPTGAAPAAGHFKLGPADTYHARPGALNPTLATNAAQNSVSFTYGTYDDPANVPTTIDILFTVTVSNAPFADGLFLTNQVREQDGSTNAGTHTADAIVQIELTEPVLNTRKGVVATDNIYSSFTPPAVGPVGFSAPGGGCARFGGTITSAGLAAMPIDSNLNDADAGDRITFAIVVENTGRGLNGAFDVRIRDTLPAGFAIPGGAPGLNLCVTDGTGTALPFTSLGAGLFDPAGGIELTDPGALTGALAAGQDGNGNPNATGSNIAIITYDLVAQIGVQPRQAIVNTATLYNYAGQNGGADHTNPADLSDTATATIAPPALVKRFVDTEINSADNAGDRAVIGELVTYEVTLTVPEGTTPNATIVDTLDAGLAFVDVLNITPSAAVTIGGSMTPVVTGSGATITFNLGAVTNADTDNENPDTITLTYRAVVLDVIGNQNGTVLNNSATFTWTGGNLSAVAAQNITVIEPSLDTAKSVVVNGSGTSGDAGDPVVYTVVIQHTGASTADAFDVTFSDPLPTAGAGGPSLIDNPTFSVVDTAGLVTAADFTLTGSNAAGWTLSTASSFDMPRAPAGRTITLTINGTLSNSVTPGASVTNTATTLWTSLDGAPGTRSAHNASSTERTGTGGVNDYSDPGAATLTVFAPNPVKTIVGTSEPYTGVQSGIERVTIGEIVRYRLEVRLAEGTSPSFQLLDRMDAGLRFLNDGTARVAFVANEAGIVSSDPTIAGAGLNVTGNTSNVVPTFVLPDAAVSISPATNSDTYNDGTDVYFKLGNLTNNDSDADSEYVVVEFNLLVTNISTSQAFNNGTGTPTAAPGTTRNNDFQVLVNGSLLATSVQGNSNRVIIAEPVVRNLSKSVTTAPGDAGDTVVYTLTFGNTASGLNAAPAFDINVTDALNANLSPQSVTGSTTGGACGTTPSTFTGTITGQTVSGNVTCLNPGGTATIVITARVVAAAPAGQIIPNNANLTSTSLPGTIGTCPNTTGSCVNSVAGFGTPGSATGERTGSDGTGLLNDYVSASSTVNVTLATPTIDKLAPSPAQYTIGDQVVYTILVTLPEGLTRNLVVFDDLPAGLAYAGHQVITTAAAGGGQLAADYGGTLAPEVLTAPGGSGGDVTLSFGNTTTTDDNNTGNNRFLVRLTARVLNLFPGNQDGVSLTNSAAVRYLNPNTAATATVNDPTPPVISLIEPRIATTKSVTPNANVQAGTVLTYVVRFTNTGNSSAYDVTAIDTLAQGTAFTALTGCVNQGGASVPASATPAGATVVFDGSPIGSWDIPATNPDSYIECTYTATAQSSLYVAGAHTNTIDADWSSQDGAANPQDRAYDDATAYPFDATQDTTSAAFSVTGVAFSKIDGGTTTATIGSVINYTLTITSPLGTIRSLVVGDTLPAGLVYGGGFTVNGISTAPVFSAGTPNDGSAPVNLTWNFGDAVVTSSPATISFSATVANVLGNQQGGARTNTATLNHRDAANVAQPVLTSSDSFTIVEPVLALNKTILTPPAPADAGGVVTYQMTIAHAPGSTSGAFDLLFTDALPAGLTNVGSLNITASGIPAPTAVIAGNTIQVPASGTFDLPLGASVTLTFQATLADNVVSDQAITNTGDVTWSSLDGSVPGERVSSDGLLDGGGLNDYEVQSSATFSVTGAPAITKALESTSDAQTTGGDVTIGEELNYALTVTLPEGTTPALRVFDDLPPGLVYNGSASLDTTGFNGTVPVPTITAPGGSGGDVTFDFGPIVVNGDNDPANNTFIIRFQARVLNIAGNVGVHPPGQTSLPNSATVQAGSGPVLASNTVPAQVVEPQITSSKSVTPAVNVQSGMVLTYTVRFSNTGTSTAYDVNVMDVLPPGVVFTALIGCVDQGGAGVPIGAFEDGALFFEGDPDPGAWYIPVGGFTECTYTVTAQDDLLIAGSFTNTINADWSSQENETFGERTYADMPRPADADQDVASATFTTGVPQFAKTDDNTTEATIGSVINYTLTITSPLGTIRDLVLQDTLPAGLVYGGSFSINGISTVPTFTASGLSLTWDFGDAVVTSSPATISFSATVANVAGNQQGGARTNTATLDYSDAGGAAQPAQNGQDSFTIVEPALTIDKTVTPASGNVGDLVTYQISIANTSTTTAYDITAGDIVPNGMAYVAGSIRIVSGPAGTTDDSAAPSLAWNFPAIPAGQTAVLAFDARIDGSGPATIANTASVAWTSRPGASADERTGADGPGGALDDYAATDSATLLTAAYEISKTLIAPAGGLAGVNDTVSFSIVITNTGATTLQTVPLTDTYPTAYLTYVGATPASDDNLDDGLINWANVGPIAPGATRTIDVTFTARAITAALPGGVTLNQAGASGIMDANGTALPTRGDDAAVAIGAPDLRVSKTDGQSSTTPGATLTYTIVVTNTGNITAAGIVLTETLPANISFAGGSVAWVAQGGGVYTYALPAPLAPGQTASVTFVVTVDNPLPAGVAQLTNTVQAGDDGARGPDPTPIDNSASDRDAVDAAPDLQLIKSDDGATRPPGEEVTYSLEYTNVGNQDATGVVITETVPLYTTFNASGSTPGWSCADGSPAGTICTFTIGNVAVGEFNNVLFAATIVNPIPAGVSEIANNAIVSDDGTNGSDPTPSDNTSSDTTPVIAAPDLRLGKSDGGTTTAPGGTILYTLSYSNTGDVGASNVTLTETVPANSTFNAGASTPGWSCANGAPAGTTCTLNVGTIAGGGASGSATFAVTVDNPLPAGVTLVTNGATVGDDGTNGSDLTPADNSASDSAPVVSAPDLRLGKSDGGTTTAPGGMIVYTLVYTNAGNIGATGVMLTETVPANSTFNAGASTPGWSCADGSPAGTTCTLNVGALAGGGANGSATFAVTVDNPLPAGVAQVANSALVSDDGTNGSDPTPADNTGSDATPVNAAPDLRLTKSDGGAMTTPGGTVVYTLSYANTGNQDATGVVLNETVPANSSFNAGASTAGWSCADGSPGGTICAFTIGNLAVGANGNVTFGVTVIDPLPAGVNQVVNSAVVADDGANGSDLTPADNTGGDTTPVTAAPDLHLSKSDGGNGTTPGGTVVYTLSYTNTGNVGASSVTIGETVPANSRFEAGASTAGWSCADGSPAGTTCILNVGTVAGGGGNGSAAFAITVDNPLPAGVTQVANSAVVSDDGANGSDPTPAGNSASDNTPVVSAPDLRLSKSDGGVTLAAGSTIVYTLSYTNTGNIGATGVVITETVPANTSFDAGASPAGWTCTPDGSAGSFCTYPVGSLASGAGGQVQFAVIVETSVSTTAITNTAVIRDDGTNGTDPTPGNNIGNENTSWNTDAIALVSFTAMPQAGGIALRWVTSAEIDTWGFHLYRSATGERAGAVRITPELILAQGRGQGGATYTWVDAGAQVGTTYTYWLQETEVGGAVNEYGPASAIRQAGTGQWRVLLAFVMR